MDANSSQVPGAGPPKKGFWGVIASLIPKRPAPLDTASPTDDAPLQSESARYNPSSTEPGRPQPAAGVTTRSHLPEGTPVEDEVDPNRSAKPLAGSQRIEEAQVPQTEETTAPNTEGEQTPPTIATPQSVKAPTIEENENYPPTLPTQPPASGGSENDTSTPEPGEPYEPKQKR